MTFIMAQGAQARKSIHKSTSIVTFCQVEGKDIYLKSVRGAKRAENTTVYILTTVCKIGVGHPPQIYFPLMATGRLKLYFQAGHW